LTYQFMNGVAAGEDPDEMGKTYDVPIAELIGQIVTDPINLFFLGAGHASKAGRSASIAAARAAEVKLVAAGEEAITKVVAGHADDAARLFGDMTTDVGRNAASKSMDLWARGMDVGDEVSAFWNNVADTSPEIGKYAEQIAEVRNLRSSAGVTVAEQEAAERLGESGRIANEIRRDVRAIDTEIPKLGGAGGLWERRVTDAVDHVTKIARAKGLFNLIPAAKQAQLAATTRNLIGMLIQGGTTIDDVVQTVEALAVVSKPLPRELLNPRAYTLALASRNKAFVFLSNHPMWRNLLSNEGLMVGQHLGEILIDDAGKLRTAADGNFWLKKAWLVWALQNGKMGSTQATRYEAAMPEFGPTLRYYSRRSGRSGLQG